jgi:hypothetical protein
MSQVSAKFLDNFFEQETPSGTVNGANTSFTLSSTPVFSKTVLLFLNGIPQRLGTDFTLAGSSITMSVAPAFGQALYCWYIKR